MITDAARQPHDLTVEGRWRGIFPPFCPQTRLRAASDLTRTEC